MNLQVLSENLQRFLDDNKFETKSEQIGSGFKIEAANAQFKVKVRILGRPNDFAVEFIPSKKTRGFSSIGMILGYITLPFGGGNLVLMDAKAQEAVSIFEDLFWDYVDEQVAELKDSGRKTSREETE